MALVGNEVLYVNGVAQNGQLSGELEPTTTGAIAALASTESAPFIVTPITTVGNGTLTAAGLVGGEITRSGPTSAFSDATDTAANIVATPGVLVGSSFNILIKNTTAFLQTITAGLGVTLPATVIVPPFSVANYVATVNSATAVALVHIDTTAISVGANSTAPSFTVLATNGAGTITAAGIAGGFTSRTTATAAFTDTTDIATAIIAATANLVNKIGTSFVYTYQNNSSAQATIQGGTGVTVSGITIIPPGCTAEYLITYTAAATLTMVGIALNNSSNISPIAAGATLSLTAANSDTVTLLNTAAGSVVTLPAALGTGNIYKFVVTTTTTSGAHKILAASSSDFLIGNSVGHTTAGATLTFSSTSASTNHSIQMPFAGTQPSGGLIGDWYEFTDVAATLWAVKGMYTAGTTATTPFSTATS